MSDIKGQTLKSLMFLKAWPCYPVLTAIYTDAVTGVKGRIETQAFPPNADGVSDWRAVHQWIDARQGVANMYFLVNPLREAKNNKALRTDLAALVALHVDVDVRVGEDQVEGIKRIVDTFHAYKTPPSIITSSGGGAQAFWLLDQPLMLDGTMEAAEDAKLYNMAIERDLDGDHCHNIDRIMRLPGTVNIPNAVKLKKGRVPALAEVIEIVEARRYGIDKFSKLVAEKPKDTTASEAPGAAEPGKAAAAPAKGVEEAFIYEGVPVASDDTPILNIDDPRLTAVDALVKQIIVLGKPPEDAPADVKAMGRGSVDMKVVSELVRCGLTDRGIKQCYKLGKLASDAAEWPRGFDGDMDRLIERAREAARDPEIEQFNREFAAIDVAGKMRIMTWRASRMYPGQFEVVLSTFDDFRLKHRNRKKVVPYKVRDPETGEATGEIKHKKVSLVDYWLRHPQMRQYNNGIAFMPATEKRSVGDPNHLILNLWTGFAVVPKEGDWSLFKAHMKDNLCGGNDEYYQYLLRWMAFIVQKKQRSQVCVLLRGNEEGSGKGFFANHYGALFGPHNMQVNNPEHIVGKFNPHLESLLVINADEALFARDPRHRNALWGLITEKWITVEPKNFAAYKAPNYLNVVITTNAEQAVPVGPTARRIFALDVLPTQCGHPEYFDAIETQLQAGGYEGMLFDLMSMDLTGFDVRQCPKTEALAVQKSFSRSGIDSLIEEACSTARVPCSHYRWPGYSITTSTNSYDGFDNYINRSSDKELAQLRALKVKRILVAEWGCVSGDETQRRINKDDKIQGLDKSHVAGVQWPPLAELRAKFEAVHGKQVWLVPSADGWITDDPQQVQPGKPTTGKLDGIM